MAFLGKKRRMTMNDNCPAFIWGRRLGHRKGQNVTINEVQELTHLHYVVDQRPGGDISHPLSFSFAPHKKLDEPRNYDYLSLPLLLSSCCWDYFSKFADSLFLRICFKILVATCRLQISRFMNCGGLQENDDCLRCI